MVAEVHYLVVRAAGRQPAVQAFLQTGRRAELAVRHLQRGELRAVQVLAFRDDEPETAALQGYQRGHGSWARLVLEQERRRVVEPPDAERTLDQPDRAIGPGDPPVAFTHVAHEHRVRREVHRVHLSEVCVADELMPGIDQACGKYIAFGGVP